MKIKIVLVGVLASMLAVAAGTVLTVYFTHPRDDAAYLADLHRTATTRAWDKAFSVQTDAYFVMQGEDACDWLSDQGLALWRADEFWELEQVSLRYAETADLDDASLWGTMRDAQKARAQIARHAFENICGATYEFHRPHSL
jgi:hypothetical protein